MKIGILTHHYISNYGAFLQAYALHKAISELFPEDEVQIINFVNVKHFIINTGGWFRFYKNRETIKSWMCKMRLPFVFAKAAKKVYPEYDSEQEILVQGIMDAYFEENDEIVLIDYKTDHVKTKEELVQRYKKQLEIYAESLEQMTGKKVKERIIYSFCLGKEIFV